MKRAVRPPWKVTRRASLTRTRMEHMMREAKNTPAKAKREAHRQEVEARERERMRKWRVKTAHELAAALHDPKRSEEQREAIRQSLLSYLAASNYLPTPEQASAMLFAQLDGGDKDEGDGRADWHLRSPSHRAWCQLIDATISPRRWKQRKERAARAQPQPQQATEPAAAERTNASTEKLAELRARLARLEFVPENEACRFQLETEIFRLEHETDSDANAAEWAGFDVIDA